MLYLPTFETNLAQRLDINFESFFKIEDGFTSRTGTTTNKYLYYLETKKLRNDTELNFADEFC